MITKSYLTIMIVISYFVGMMGGYIIKSEVSSNIFSLIITISFGLVFVIYLVPIILEHKEEN